MTSNTRVLVAQLGARKHYQEPLIFHNRGMLDRLYTDLYSGHSPIATALRQPSLYRRLPNALKKGLDRYDPGLKTARVIHFPKFGYRYAQALKQASPDQASQIFIWGGQEFCRRIIRRGLGTATTIYGFNSACLELFEHAKARGVRCVLDQTLADYSRVHQLLLEEEQLWPGWSVTPFTVTDADLSLMQREHREQELADRIVCGSDFVKDSLSSRGIAAANITVVPLGRLKQATLPQPRSTHESRAEAPLKILFVGSVGLRKGIPYLLTALRQLQGEIPFVCKVVGPLEIQPERIAEYSDICEFMGRVPRSQVKDLYEWTDVFVLPSLCEGSAMVTYEALSSGVPVITTYNAGSVVRDGIDGFLVPIRDSQAIAEKLIEIYRSGCSAQKKNDPQYLHQLFESSESKLIYTVAH